MRVDRACLLALICVVKGFPKIDKKEDYEC